MESGLAQTVPRDDGLVMESRPARSVLRHSRYCGPGMGSNHAQPIPCQQTSFPWNMAPVLTTPLYSYGLKMGDGPCHHISTQRLASREGPWAYWQRRKINSCPSFYYCISWPLATQSPQRPVHTVLYIWPVKYSLQPRHKSNTGTLGDYHSAAESVNTLETWPDVSYIIAHVASKMNPDLTQYQVNTHTHISAAMPSAHNVMSENGRHVSATHSPTSSNRENSINMWRLQGQRNKKPLTLWGNYKNEVWSVKREAPSAQSWWHAQSH